MSVQELLHVLKPPPVVRRPGVPELWPAVEAALGTPLPSDNKEFINHFGSGLICDFLRIYDPFLSDSTFDLGWIHNVIAMYQVFDVKQFPDPLFPATDGLLPCGKTDNGGIHMTWKTGGLPDTWPVAIINFDTLRVDYLSMSLTHFIIGFIRKEYSPNLLNWSTYQESDCPDQFTPL